MPNDDIIITGLNESVSSFFENRTHINEDLASRMTQRQANSMNGDLTGMRGFMQRNSFNAGAAADHVLASMQNRFTNPQFLMQTLPQLGQNAVSGAERARMEHQQKQEQRKLDQAARELQTEQKNVQREAEDLQKEQQKVNNEGFAGNALDWMIGTPDGGTNTVAKDNVTGSNVNRFYRTDPTTGKQQSVNIMTDTRTQGQRRADVLTGMAKSAADQYVQNALDTGLSVASDKIGYGLTKAKLAIQDMKAKKAQAKAEAQQLREAKRELKNNQSKI